MFYLLLIIPHVGAIAGMLWWAFRQTDNDGGTYGDNWWGDWTDPDEPTPIPPTGPSAIGPPLPDALQPRPRMRPGEQLAERALPVPRREHEHPAPRRQPARVDE
jgi:hypothetical protein